MNGCRLLSSRILLLLVLASSGLALHDTTVAQDHVTWETSIDTAREMAARQHRLVLVHFWSESCGPCLQLERTVFHRREFARALHANYVPVKVNVAENASLTRTFKVDRIPTDIILSPDGRELFRTISPADANKYVSMLDQVAAHVRVAMEPQATPRHDVADSVPVTPPTGIVSSHASQASDGGAAGPRHAIVDNPYMQTERQNASPENQSPSTGSRYASNAAPISPAYASATDQSSAFSRRFGVQSPRTPPPLDTPAASIYSTPSATSVPPQSPAVHGPYASPTVSGATTSPPYGDASAPNATDSAYPSNPYARSSPFTPTGPLPATSLQPPMDPRPATSPYGPYAAPPYAAQPNVPPQTTAGGPAHYQLSSSSADPSWMTQPPMNRQGPRFDRGPAAGPPSTPNGPALPPVAPTGSLAGQGTAPPGLDGYCPVALVEERTWRSGNPQFIASHEGRIYFFSSPEYQQAFLRDPQRYAPVLAGFDVVRYREQGVMVPGKRQHGVAYRGRYYLFADEAALQRFWQAPEQFASVGQPALNVADRNTRRP